MVLIFAGLVMIGLLIVIKKLYVKNWDKGLSVTLELSASEVYPGDEVVIIETVYNRKWLPLPIINVKFAIDRNLKFVGDVENTNESDKSYKCDVYSLLFYQKIMRRIPFRCAKRGYYVINSLDVVSTDMFMRSVLSTIVPLQQQLIVYPEPIDSAQVDILYQQIMGTIVTKRYQHEDPFEFRGIREYQTYDTMKSINWNASARSGELKVNVYQDTSAQEVCILLNLEDEGVWVYEDLKEKSISLAGSLASRLIRQGILVSVLSNGADCTSGKEVYLEAGSDETHSKNIITALSKVDLNKGMKDFTELLQEYESRIKKGAMLILISSCKKERLQEAFSALCAEYSDSIWILPIGNGMDDEMSKVNPANVRKWEVSH